MKRLLFILLATAGFAFGFSKDGTVYTLDTIGTKDYQDDFVAAVADADAGDTINIQATGGGEFIWPDQFSLPSIKHLTIQGQGAGGVISYSETTFDVSNPPASKVFTIYELFHTTPADSSTGIGSYVTEPEFTVGETLFFRFSPRGLETYIEGEVTAYSYPNLTVDVISVTQGSDDGGTPDASENRWQIVRPAATTLNTTVAPASGQSWLTVINATTGNHHIKGIKFKHNIVSPDGNRFLIRLTDSSDGEPTLITDCAFEHNSSGRLIYSSANKGLLKNCSAVIWDRAISHLSTRGVLRVELGGDVDGPSWSTPSTMGRDAPDEKSAFVVEDCIISGYSTSFYDGEGHSKAVFRYTTFLNSAAISGHGQDTGLEASLRHYDVYKIAFLSRSDGSQGQRSYRLTSYLSPRGGTFVFFSNYVQGVEQSGWSSSTEITPEVYTLRRPGGFYGCWGNDGPTVDTVFPAAPDASGEGWPAPRQPGMGYVDGLYTDVGAGGYRGDPEPMWVWGTTGLATLDMNKGNYGSNLCGDFADSAAAYLEFDRDDDDTWGIYDNGAWIGSPVSLIERSVSGKPEYAPYTYPHPLSPAEVGSRPVVAISSPTHPATAAMGASVTLSGTATDAEDGTISSGIVWRSSIDGTIGTGASVMTSTLTKGHHIIYATSTDTDDQFVIEALALEITDAGTGAHPVVTITAPADDSIYESGSEVTMTATATDAEDGDIAANVTWTSSLDGSLGTGASVMTSTLSDGQHVITASVTDSDANMDADAISITMGITRTRLNVGTLKIIPPTP